MNGIDLGLIVLAAGLGWLVYQDWAHERTRENEDEALRPPWLAPDITGLVHVDDLLAGTLISPRGVELRVADGWDFADVMATLADIDSLGEIAA